MPEDFQMEESGTIEDGNVSLTEEQLLRLRMEDPTQYSTLVKMHLSFTTDLSTAYDSVDGRRSGSSSTSWRQLAPLMRWLGGGGSKRPPSPYKDEGNSLTPQLLQQLQQIIMFLGIYSNVITEGLFRKCGSSSRQAELRQQLVQESPAALAAALATCSPHDVASLLKGLLADLPEPLLQDHNFALHCKLAELGSNDSSASSAQTSTITYCRRVKALQLLLLLLPPQHLQLLRPLLQLLHTVAAHKHLNRMTSANLGMVFAPHILCPRKLSGSELQQHSAIAGNAVAFMVKHAPKLFQVPVELECDVKQYWTNRADAAMRQQLQHSMCCASFLQCHDSLDTTTAGAQQDDDASIITSASSGLHPFDFTACHHPHDSSTVSSYCGRAVVPPDPCFSPNHDPTLAHTVFSFVDRAQTQAASARETTALALAELYAHVNSLPDSDKKRRLVKQFNAASGHGTPSYGSQGGGAATSRAAAFANSIKKHLLRAGSRKDAGCGAGLQKAATAGGHLQGKKSGSYSPRRAFQQSLHQGAPSAEKGFTLRYHPGTPNTFAICPHGHTPKTPATPHSHHHQQPHGRAKSWDNLTTPKNLRKCLFPSSPSPFLLRKKTTLPASKGEPTADVPCSAKGSKSCTALCSRCSQRPLNNLRTANDNAGITSDKNSQAIASDKASQTTANDVSLYPTVAINSLSYGSQSSVSESTSLHSSADSMQCSEATAVRVPSAPASPSVRNTPMETSSSAMVHVPPTTCQGSESGRPSLWRTNDPSLSSLCKRAEELIDISRSRTLQGRVPIAPCNYNVSERPSHNITTAIDSSTAGLDVTQNAHDQGYSVDGGSNSCTKNITSNTQVPLSSFGIEVMKDSASSCCHETRIRISGFLNPPASCPSFPRTSTVNPCNEDVSSPEDAGYVRHSNVSLEDPSFACCTTLCSNLAGKSVINEDCSPISHHLLESISSSVHGSNSSGTTPVAVLKLGSHPGLACGVVPVSVHDLAQSPGSPLTNAVLHDSISQALVLTPRSRCPIVATRNGGRGTTATSTSTVAALARHNLSSAQRHSITGAAASLSSCPTEFGGEEQRHLWKNQATSGPLSREDPAAAWDARVGLVARSGIGGTVVTGDGVEEVCTGNGFKSVRIVGSGDGNFRDSRNKIASECHSSECTENVPPAVEIHYSSAHLSEARFAGDCRHNTVSTEIRITEESKTCSLVRRKSTLNRKNASDSDILEISRKSSFRKEDPKKSSSSKNVSSLGKAVRRSLSRRLSKSWRRSNKAGGMLARQGGSSMLDSDQDTVDSGLDTSNALFGSDDTSSRGDFHSDLSSQDIDLESSGAYYSSQRAQCRSATGSESELVPDFSKLMEDQKILRRSSGVRPDVCTPVGNKPMATGYHTKSPLSPFSNTPPPGVRDSRYYSSTSEALGSFFKHLSSSSLAEIAKRLKTYNDPALVNSSYRMLSPIESDTSSCSLPSTPVKELDESLSLVFREYLESRAIVMGQEGSEDDGPPFIAGCEEKCRSDPLFESCSVASFSSSGCSCSGAICSGGRSVSCGAINSLALSLPTNSRDELADEKPLEIILSPSGGDESEGVAVGGSVLKIRQEEQITDSFHSVEGEFSESLLRCLDGQNPLSESCDATTGRWEAADDLKEEQVSPRKAVKGAVPRVNRAVSYKSAVDLGEILSVNLMGVTTQVSKSCASDHNLRGNRGLEANKENSSPEKLCDDAEGKKNDNLTQNKTLYDAYISSSDAPNSKHRSPLRPRKDCSNLKCSLVDPNIPAKISSPKSCSSSLNLGPLKVNETKLQDSINNQNSSPDTPPGIHFDELLINSTACHSNCGSTSTPPLRPPLTTAQDSEDTSCCSHDARCQKLLGTKHGTPIKSLQSGACAQLTKVHFETSL